MSKCPSETPKAIISSWAEKVSLKLMLGGSFLIVFAMGLMYFFYISGLIETGSLNALHSVQTSEQLSRSLIEDIIPLSGSLEHLKNAANTFSYEFELTAIDTERTLQPMSAAAENLRITSDIVISTGKNILSDDILRQINEYISLVEDITHEAHLAASYEFQQLVRDSHDTVTELLVIIEQADASLLQVTNQLSVNVDKASKAATTQLTNHQGQIGIMLQQVQKAFYTLFFFIFIALTGLYWLTRKRLRTVINYVKSIADGQYDTCLGYTNADELGNVARQVEKMSQKLTDIFHEAQTQTQRAEHANQAKSDFLSRMSHELRTPLNAILGLAQLIEHNDNPKTYKGNAREIAKSGEHLLGLINEVLDLSKIESGRLDISMEVVSLDNVLDNSMTFIKPLATDRQIKIAFESPHYCELFVYADFTRLKQVFLNLLSNAVKYNQKNGYIGISCIKNDTGKVRISIHDTGSGIAEEQIEQLFIPFNRLGREFDTIEGTGIGLVIVKQLVEKMGGRLGVESTTDQGSTFWIELNMAEPPEQEHTVQQIPEKTDATSADLIEDISIEAKVLIAEDNITNQFVLQQQLETLGVDAEFAKNGVIALKKWREGNFDLLLTDIQMPVMNGYELVSNIRHDEKQTGKPMPLIAITANAMPTDIKNCLDKGMNAVVTKPTSLQSLQTTLKKWLPEKVSEKSKPEKKENALDKAVKANSVVPVDMAIVQSIVGNNPEKHCFLFKIFIDSTPEIIQAINSAYSDHLAEIIMQQAHKLKSSARNMGASVLADVCLALETAGTDDDWDTIAHTFPQLDGAFNDVIAFMNDYCHQAPAKEDAVEPFYQQLKILLLDDDRLSLDLEEMMLNKMGINDVSATISGVEALNKIDALNGAIDVILCDLSMPEMDGIEFLRHLANRNYTGALILVSGVEKRILETAKKLAIEHQINVLDAINKPILPAALKGALSKLEKTPSRLQPKARQPKSPLISVEELKQGIENDELVNYFQPKIDITSHEVVSVESLVRWQHSSKGLIAPGLFIQLAEENNLIETLTQAVFKQAMQHATTLKESGFNISMAINISVDTLVDLNWPEYADIQASNAGIDPESIILEITESRLMNNLTSALEILTRLSLKKFKLSIDDFGTGYSSMEQLQRVPFSELKIDRAFVNGAAHDISSRAILESSVALAKRLNMKTVAEGVETQEDWDLVAELGCDLVQGYFIAKPMSFPDLQHWLNHWNKK